MAENKKKRAKYNVKNWSAYNQALRQRGSITVWLDEEAIRQWYSEGTCKRGRPCVYSALAIETALTLAAVFRQPLRACQGLVDSLLAMLAPALRCPDYTTLSRRRCGLSPAVRQYGTLDRDAPIHIAIDSTGIKVYGEGEWKVRKHGASKRRTWRVLHLAVNTKSHQVVAEVTTTNDVADAEAIPALLPQIQSPIAKATADGAYDTKATYQAFSDRGTHLVTPPRRGAVPQCPQIITAKYNPALAPRDAAIRRIAALGGDDDARKHWKIETAYHQRSLSETAMYRRKTLFSNTFSARSLHTQKIESTIIINAMNKMTSLGMPDSFTSPL